MIVLIPYINLLNLSWIIKCLFLRNMELLRVGVGGLNTSKSSLSPAPISTLVLLLTIPRKVIPVAVIRYVS